MFTFLLHILHPSAILLYHHRRDVFVHAAIIVLWKYTKHPAWAGPLLALPRHLEGVYRNYSSAFDDIHLFLLGSEFVAYTAVRTCTSLKKPTQPRRTRDRTITPKACKEAFQGKSFNFSTSG